MNKLGRCIGVCLCKQQSCPFISFEILRSCRNIRAKKKMNNKQEFNTKELDELWVSQRDASTNDRTTQLLLTDNVFLMDNIINTYTN